MRAGDRQCMSVRYCRWGKHVIVYGDAGLKKDNPVVEYLAKEGQCASLRYYKEG